MLSTEVFWGLLLCPAGAVESNMCSNTVTEGVAAGLAAADDAVTVLVEAVLGAELRSHSHEELTGLLSRVRRLAARRPRFPC